MPRTYDFEESCSLRLFRGSIQGMESARDAIPRHGKCHSTHGSTRAGKPVSATPSDAPAHHRQAADAQARADAAYPRGAGGTLAPRRRIFGVIQLLEAGWRGAGRGPDYCALRYKAATGMAALTLALLVVSTPAAVGTTPPAGGPCGVPTHLLKRLSPCIRAYADACKCSPVSGGPLCRETGVCKELTEPSRCMCMHRHMLHAACAAVPHVTSRHHARRQRVRVPHARACVSAMQHRPKPRRLGILRGFPTRRTPSPSPAHHSHYTRPHRRLPRRRRPQHAPWVTGGNPQTFYGQSHVNPELARLRCQSEPRRGHKARVARWVFLFRPRL